MAADRLDEGGAARRRLAGWTALLLAALALIAWQLRGADGNGHAEHGDHADAAPQLLVGPPAEDWGGVELLHRGERVRFERDADGRWLRHEARADEAASHAHRADAAAAEAIGQVLATLSRARIERTLPADPTRAAGYGLANPALIVLVQGRDGRALQTLEFGDLAADGLSRYVHLPRTRQVHTVPDYHLRGLLTLLAPASPVGPASAALPAPGRTASGG